MKYIIIVNICNVPITKPDGVENTRNKKKIKLDITDAKIAMITDAIISTIAIWYSFLIFNFITF